MTPYDLGLAISGLGPSRICLGTAGFGTTVSRKESFELLDTFVALGGNFLDSANIYASWLPGGEGASERTIGEWMRDRESRATVVLATKGGHPPLSMPPQYGDCSKAAIEQHLNQSLDRLGTDYIDLYWLHRDDPRLPVGEMVETLAGFHRNGRIRAYGVSNWTVRRIEAANAYAAKKRLPALAASQPGWSLAEPPPDSFEKGGLLFLDEPAWRWHSATRMPVVPYSSQAKGFFGAANAAWAKSGFQGPAPVAAPYDLPINRRRLLSAIRLAEDKGCTPGQIALAYLLNQPFPVYPIIGTRQPARLRAAWDCLDLRLTAAEQDELQTSGDENA